MIKLKTLGKYALAFALTSSPAFATTITFDGTGAPGLFVQTSQLTDRYADLGVLFSGVGALGGSILNQSGSFGFSARSGTDFLAFNTRITGNQEMISFTKAVTSASIWVANATTNSYTFMHAYDANGTLLASSSVAGLGVWQQLSVQSTGASSISKLILTGAGNAYAYDDLDFSVSAVPEPETYALMLTGLVGVVLGARRRKQQS